jgi:hypothetical protein
MALLQPADDSFGPAPLLTALEVGREAGLTCGSLFRFAVQQVLAERFGARLSERERRRLAAELLDDPGMRRLCEQAAGDDVGRAD